MTRLRHFDKLGTGRFVTFSTYRRHQLLKRNAIASLFVKALDQIRSRHTLRLWGYVVMPDHVHLVMLPCENKGGVSLGRIVGELKSVSARAILTYLRTEKKIDLGNLTRSDESISFWQRRCYDHNCRSSEIVV